MRAGRGTDPVILGLTLCLLCVGIVMVYSATFATAEHRFGSEFFFLKRHVIFALIGFAALMVGRHIDYHWLAGKWIVYGAMGFSAVLLILVLIFGQEINGSKRWLDLGPVNLQPLEVAKVSVVLFLAYSISVKRGRIKRFSNGLLPLLLIPGVLIALILVQPDFGGSVLLALFVFGMLFVGGARYVHLSGLSVLGATGGAYLVWSNPYRMKRLLSFLDPWADPQGASYQLCNSLVGFAKGGWHGMGPGQGEQKLFYVPELHTDFIFSNIAEELGLIGVVVMLVLFGLLVMRIVRVSLRAGDETGRMLAFGVGLMMALQIVINIGVVMGMLPTKGLTLPLVSYGGSSLLSTMFLIGLVLNVAGHHKDYDEPVDHHVRAEMAREWSGA